MKGAFAIIFCCVVFRVSGNEQPKMHEELSQENKDALNAIWDIMACIDEGQCSVAKLSAKPSYKGLPENSHTPVEEVPLESVKVEAEPVVNEVKSHYMTLCQKFAFKLDELESLHPELKPLKVRFLEKLNTYASRFTTDFKEGESLVTKILDLVIIVAEKLKKDFAEEEHTKEIPFEEVVEESDIGFVGSIRGISGVDYPNYTEVPITSFNCHDKNIPGFYADLETGCQVFHVCYEHRRESFLCPLGTIFNQPILACDYWYSANCSQASSHYDVNEKEIEETTIEEGNVEVIETLVEEKPETSEQLKNLVKFLPVKAKIIQFPTEPEAKPVVSSIDGVDKVAANIFEGIISTGMLVASKARQAVKLFPKHKPVLLPKVKPLPLIKAKLAVKAPLVKAKVVSGAAVPIVKSKVVVAKIPAVKAKFVTAAAIPVVKGAKVAKAAVPFYKVKAVAAAAASKPVKAAVPLVKVKKMAKIVPVVAATSKLAVPLVKAKLAKSAAISPLTKKALALGYLKLLKAKKFALVG